VIIGHIRTAGLARQYHLPRPIVDLSISIMARRWWSISIASRPASGEQGAAAAELESSFAIRAPSRKAEKTGGHVGRRAESSSRALNEPSPIAFASSYTILAMKRLLERSI